MRKAAQQPYAAEPRPRTPKTPYAPPQFSGRVYVRLAPADIALFRFLLEAHGHLGIMTVADRCAAILKVSFSPDCRPELLAFLAEAAQCLTLTVTALPAQPG